MAFKSITAVATENFIIVMYKGRRTQITKSEKPNEFELIREYIKNKDEESIIKVLGGNAEVVQEHSSGMFTIDRDRQLIIDKETNTEVSMTISKRVLAFANDGLPFEPLLKFHRKVQELKKVAPASADELFEFLEKNKIAITTEGNFLAYKKVKTKNGRLVDCHTQTVDNSIGNVVKKKRETCDHNRRNNCSNGLHVAGWSYMSSFSGDVILEVEVEPQHVVSVPVDYNFAKMRVCQYKVLREVDKERNDKLVTVKKLTVSKSVVPQDDKTTDVVGKISADVQAIDFTVMTAQKIKDYIKEKYNIDITTDNKNKQQIIKQANKIVHAQPAANNNPAPKEEEQISFHEDDDSDMDMWGDDDPWGDDEDEDDEDDDDY